MSLPEVPSLASETAKHKVEVVVCRWSSQSGHTPSAVTSDTMSMLISSLPPAPYLVIIYSNRLWIPILPSFSACKVLLKYISECIFSATMNDKKKLFLMETENFALPFRYALRNCSLKRNIKYAML